MNIVARHPTKKWEISIQEFQDGQGALFKVTRSIPELSVAETKFFRSKKDAQEQVVDWLR